MGQFSVEICHLVGQFSMKLNSRAKCDKQKRLHGGAVTRIIIETQRLSLRSYREDDLSDLVTLIGNWEVARWVSTVLDPSAQGEDQVTIQPVSQPISLLRQRMLEDPCLPGGHRASSGGPGRCQTFGSVAVGVAQLPGRSYRLRYHAPEPGDCLSALRMTSRLSSCRIAVMATSPSLIIASIGVRPLVGADRFRRPSQAPAFP